MIGGHCCNGSNPFFRNDPRSWLEWGLGEAGTALFAAAEQRRGDVVAYLLSRGADATLVSNKGRTALDVAERLYGFCASNESTLHCHIRSIHVEIS
jgi:hypothetical protein